MRTSQRDRSLSASRPLLSAFSTTGRAQPESSFNTNGSAPPYDLMKRFGGLTEEDAWLAPNPGGAASWGLGYYPAGVKGVRLSAAAPLGAAFSVRFSSVVVLCIFQ